MQGMLERLVGRISGQKRQTDKGVSDQSTVRLHLSPYCLMIIIFGKDLWNSISTQKSDQAGVLYTHKVHSLQARLS